MDSRRFWKAAKVSCYRAFHRILPTHRAQSWTSSLCIILSTVYHSFANSSLEAMRCTKLWHALQSQATLFSVHSSCHPFFRTLAWTPLGIRWWYVNGIQSRPHISQALVRVLLQTGGPAVVMEIYSLRICRRKAVKSAGSDMNPYTESDSGTDRGTRAANASRVVRGIGSAYAVATEEFRWMEEYDRDWNSSGNESKVSPAIYWMI
jgi:hypothetical protein